ncbi:hypothetical protein [Hoeflea sp.]|uniref:hypothetical protein n=1 Tax=Hoeflea sp. TaxID=1940281 RepID=UPI003B01C7DD
MKLLPIRVRIRIMARAANNRDYRFHRAGKGLRRPGTGVFLRLTAASSPPLAAY